MCMKSRTFVIVWYDNNNFVHNQNPNRNQKKIKCQTNFHCRYGWMKIEMIGIPLVASRQLVMQPMWIVYFFILMKGREKKIKKNTADNRPQTTAAYGWRTCWYSFFGRNSNNNNNFNKNQVIPFVSISFSIPNIWKHIKLAVLRYWWLTSLTCFMWNNHNFRANNKYVLCVDIR